MKIEIFKNIQNIRIVIYNGKICKKIKNNNGSQTFLFMSFIFEVNKKNKLPFTFIPLADVTRS